MKKILSILMMLGVMLAGSCKKEEKITGKPSPLISVADIKSMYQEAPLVLKTDNMMGATSICGIVISDPGNGNAPNGLVIMQSYRRKQLRGIALALGAEASQYTAGDSIVVKVDGSTLERVNGILQISKLPAGAVSKISSGNPQKVHTSATTFTSITNSMAIYESTLVQLRSAVVENMTVGQTFVGEIPLSDWANTILMHTEATASFASKPVPGLGDYTGIALFNAAKKPSFWLRSENDYVGQSLEPYKPDQLYLNFPEGWETHTTTPARKSAYTGTLDVFPSGEWLMPDMYSISSANIVNKNGTWAVMMRNSTAPALAMNFNLPYGASKFSFYYGAATLSATDANLPITVRAEYSQDSGNTWQSLGDNLLVTVQNMKYFKEYILDIKGPVRFRISKDAANARLFVDDVAVYQN
ncbi:MAG: DUF5689 domain-containing protein [Pedobacter sp.]|uniref:DUF5689 domain-containing protein n=1 Tax=Pedobacter sp. TaxID=1411316 RepID=UPI00280808AD|nr:DUF5689 domain-containing protein [Pedobacter sp.]MDQ8005535.1 DUF5689 domain-containing protein [Pedobacter sp.]